MKKNNASLCVLISEGVKSLFCKKREKSKKLLVLESLYVRSEFREEIKYEYFSLRKGEEIEFLFESKLVGKTDDCLVFADLNLKAGSRYFQVDFIIVQDDAASIYEIKGVTGAHVYGREYFETDKDYRPDNPLEQLTKCKNRVREIFRRYGIHLKVEGYVVFMDPGFWLYGMPKLSEFILPGQVDQHIDSIQKSTHCRVKNPQKIINALYEASIPEYPYTEYPPYTFAGMRKGLYCKECFSFAVAFIGHDYCCKKCGFCQPVREGVVDAAREFQRLFPETKITTGRIYDWLGGTVDYKRIQRTLQESFERHGKTSGTYYR